jgi:hypothetical protein
MPVTNNPPTTPDEDPSALTQAAVERASTASRDYVDGQVGMLIERIRGIAHTEQERFRGIDRATVVLNDIITQVPTDLQTAQQTILRLMDERDRRIVGEIAGLDERVSARFDANALLSQTESSLNQTALAAALAAQEKAAAVQVDTFSSLIRGLGERIDRTIDKNAELASVSANALSARVTQLTDSVTRSQQQIGEILAGRTAVAEQRVDTRGGSANIYGLVGAVVSFLSMIIAAVAVIIATR